MADQRGMDLPCKDDTSGTYMYPSDEEENQNVHEFDLLLKLLKLAATGFVIGVCNFCRIPYLGQGDERGSFLIAYAVVLVVIEQSLNIFPWPKLKGWIRQFLREVKPAVLILLLLLLGLCCMARDSFIHYMVKGKVLLLLLLFGAAVYGAGIDVDAIINPNSWDLSRDAFPQIFVILILVFAVCTYPPLHSQVVVCFASLVLFINCCSLLFAITVVFFESFMKCVTDIHTTELPPEWYAIFIMSFMLVVLKIINFEVHVILQAPFTGVEEPYALPTARPRMQLPSLSSKVTCIPQRVYSRVCLMLNIRRILRFDDFRMLAEKVGLDGYEIQFVGQLENPTDVVLSTWSSSPDATVGRLIELLKDEDLKRMDVAEVLEKWVNNEE